MEILLFFQNLRNPFFNKIFSFLTFFGEETFVILLICLFVWCINKDLAQRLGFVFSYSMVLNQILKITFCIPRPWIRYNIKPYEGALKHATGYSFPSGHTQTSATVYFGIADYFKRKRLYIFAFLFALLIGISRLYFGVHTVVDVVIGFCSGVICVFVFGKLYEKYSDKPVIPLITGFIVSLFFVIYACFKKYPPDAEAKLIYDCFKQSGLMIGYFAALYLEKKYLNYSVKGKPLVQIIKFIVGITVLLGLKLFFKKFLPSYFLYFIEYFILVFWCVYLYPLIFTKFISWRNEK